MEAFVIPGILLGVAAIVFLLVGWAEELGGLQRLSHS